MSEQFVLYQIHWELTNGAKGHGTPIRKELAESWLTHMKENHPDDKYWIKPVVVEAQEASES